MKSEFGGDIKNRTVINKLINFNEFKIFKSALGQHNMITLLSKCTNNSKKADTYIIEKTGVASEKDLIEIFNKNDNKTEYNKIKQSELYSGADNIINLYSRSSPIHFILNKMEENGESLGDICDISQGIVTGANKITNKHIEKYENQYEKDEGIFILTSDEIKHKDIDVNNDHIKPWYKNSDINKYTVTESPKLHLIYYKDNKTVQEINSNILSHFEKYKELLTERLSVCKKNKFQWNIVSKWIDRGEYYLLFYPRKEEIFNSPKIVCPQRSKKNIFGYTSNPWYAASDVYFINNKLDNDFSLKYILGLINSKIYYLWLYYRGKRKGESLELMKTPLSKIPIIKATIPQQEKIIEKVDIIIFEKNNNPNANIVEIESELDELIFDLYELTPAERETVLNS